MHWAQHFKANLSSMHASAVDSERPPRAQATSTPASLRNNSGQVNKGGLLDSSTAASRLNVLTTGLRKGKRRGCSIREPKLRNTCTFTAITAVKFFSRVWRGTSVRYEYLTMSGHENLSSSFPMNSESECFFFFPLPDGLNWWMLTLIKNSDGSWPLWFYLCFGIVSTWMGGQRCCECRMIIRTRLWCH